MPSVTESAAVVVDAAVAAAVAVAVAAALTGTYLHADDALPFSFFHFFQLNKVWMFSQQNVNSKY